MFCISSCFGMNQDNLSMTEITSMLCYGCRFGMKQEDSSMTEMNDWRDLAQFAGQIIAYQANSPYYCSEEGYKIDNQSTIRFGQVSSAPIDWSGIKSPGYTLARVIKKDSNGSICALLHSYLSEGFWARHATQEEIEKIKNALKNKQARWNI